MKLSELIEHLQLREFTDTDMTTRDVQGGYVSDMLSDVLTNASPGDVWVTVQKHPNIIAIAGMRDVAAIILVKDRQPDEETLHQANEEKLPMLGTSLSAFELVGQLYQLGLRG